MAGVQLQQLSGVNNKCEGRKFMADVAEIVTEEVVADIVPPVVVTPPEEKKAETNSDNKEEIVTEEKKVEEPEKEKVSDDLAGLKAEIAKLQEDLATAKANGDSKVEKSTHDQVNELLKVKDGLVSDYEGILTEIIGSKMLGVPENLKELVPTNISLKEQLAWITKAEKSGIFKQGNPDIEIGKPLNPNNKQTIDTSKLSASSIMAMAYSNSVGKGKK